MDGNVRACYVHSVSIASLHRRAWLVLAVVSLVLGWAFPAFAAYTPPPLVGHVVDEAGALTASERAALDAKLDHARKTKGPAVVVLLVGPLDGTPIEDVAYTAFNTWGVGASGKDDGVLLVVAPSDRKLRIETGKGVGGALTDVQSSHINREIIGPALAKGDTYGALDRGTDAILAALAKDPSLETPPGAQAQPRNKSPFENPIVIGVIVLVLIVVVALSIVSRTFRMMLFGFLRILFFFLSVFGGRGGGGGGGGSSYGGGGGRSGGGGSSDDY